MLPDLNVVVQNREVLPGVRVRLIERVLRVQAGDGDAAGCVGGCSGTRGRKGFENGCESGRVEGGQEEEACCLGGKRFTLLLAGVAAKAALGSVRERGRAAGGLEPLEPILSSG